MVNGYDEIKVYLIRVLYKVLVFSKIQCNYQVTIKIVKNPHKIRKINEGLQILSLKFK